MPLKRAPLNRACEQAREKVAMMVEASPDPVIVYLEGGHYSALWGEDEFSLSTQRHALALATNLILDYKDRVRIVFGIMKEDIGLQCGEDEEACQAEISGERGHLEGMPPGLKEILEGSPVVKFPKLLLFSERAAKNRGIARLRRIFPDNRPAEHEIPEGLYMDWSADKAGVYFTSRDLQEVKLADVSGHVWNAKCPTLMGQHYSDILLSLSRRFHHGYPAVIVDYSVIMDRNKVTRGSEAALRYFRTRDGMSRGVRIVNLFYDDPEGERAIVRESTSEDY